MAKTLNQAGQCDYDEIRKSLINQLPLPPFRETLTPLLDAWEKEFASVSSMALSFALASAEYSYQRARRESALELVWTGPTTGGIPLRRTEQSLLQLIHGAQTELLIVSFAVYDIEEIVKALDEAVSRAVNVTLVVETPESSQGKINFGAAAVLSESLKIRASILQWDYDQREKDAQGRHGSLHAKCAVADRQRLLLSSANLTGYALNLSMEMGVLINNASIATQTVEHFHSLRTLGVLTAI